jgi:hypothetical protein
MPSSPYRVTIEILERITGGAWRWVASSRALWVLSCMLLVATLVGGMLPQVHSGAASPDPLGQERALGESRYYTGAGLGLLDSLGITRLYHSRLFQALLAAIAAVAFLRLLLLWIPGWAPPPSQPTTSFTCLLPGDTAAVWVRVAQSVRGLGQGLARWLEDDGAQHALIRDRGLRRWPEGLLCLGILMMLLAAVVASRYGWAGPRLELALGERQPVGPQAGHAIQLEDLVLQPRADGSLQRIDSQVSLWEGTSQELLSLGPGRHATRDGFSIYQLGYGPAVRLSVRNAQGQDLGLLRMGENSAPHPLVRVRFAAQQQEQLLAVPEGNLVLRLVYYPGLPAQGLNRRALHVQLYRGTDGRLLTEQFLDQDGVISAEDIVVSVAFEYYVVLRAEREPELPIAALGGLSLLLGVATLAFWPPRRAWVSVLQVAPGVTEVAPHCIFRLVVGRQAAGSPWVQHLLATLPCAESDMQRVTPAVGAGGHHG